MEDTWYVDILLGAVNLDTRAPGSLLMTSFNYQVHPGYDPSTLANDLAIVQLPIGIDVRSSRDTPPPLITLCLRLPASYLPSVSRTLSRTPVRSPSWAGARRGTPGPGSALTSSMSRWAAHMVSCQYPGALCQVSRISEAACSEYYGPLGPGVGCVEGPSTCQVTTDDKWHVMHTVWCQGDSGGSVVTRGEGQVWVLTGIVSFGSTLGCEVKCLISGAKF